MNPHSKGGHAAADRRSAAWRFLPCESCLTRPRSGGMRHTLCVECYNAKRYAPTPPPFPRRTIVADYCRECGRTSDCWQGCAGGERVAAISHTRSPASARITSTENERTPLVAVLGGSGLNGVLEQIGPAHE